MTTIIEDLELEAELQELYLQSKKWLTDLAFLEKEVEIIEALFEKNLISNKELIEIQTNQVEILKQSHLLSTNLKGYLNKLKIIILAPNKACVLETIEAYNHLDREIKDLFASFHQFKEKGLSITKHL